MPKQFTEMRESSDMAGKQVENDCRVHSSRNLTVGCSCAERHCPECAHPLEGFEAKFMDMLRECARKSNEDQRRTAGLDNAPVGTDNVRDDGTA